MCCSQLGICLYLFVHGLKAVALCPLPSDCISALESAVSEAIAAYPHTALVCRLIYHPHLKQTVYMYVDWE